MLGYRAKRRLAPRDDGTGPSRDPPGTSWSNSALIAADRAAGYRRRRDASQTSSEGTGRESYPARAPRPAPRPAALYNAPPHSRLSFSLCCSPEHTPAPKLSVPLQQWLPSSSFSSPSWLWRTAWCGARLRRRRRRCRRWRSTRPSSRRPSRSSGTRSSIARTRRPSTRRSRRAQTPCCSSCPNSPPAFRAPSATRTARRRRLWRRRAPTSRRLPASCARRIPRWSSRRGSCATACRRPSPPASPRPRSWPRRSRLTWTRPTPSWPPRSNRPTTTSPSRSRPSRRSCTRPPTSSEPPRPGAPPFNKYLVRSYQLYHCRP